MKIIQEYLPFESEVPSEIEFPFEKILHEKEPIKNITESIL